MSRRDETADLVSKIDAEEKKHLARLEELRTERERITGIVSGPEPVSAARFLAEPHPPIPWLLGGLIAESSVGLMTADGGIGKTTLLVQACLSMAAGHHVFGYRVEKPTPVLMVLAEGSRAAFQARFRTTLGNLGFTVDRLPWFIQPADLTEYQIGSSGLDRMIEKSGARFVVLDTIGYFHGGDENDANDWKQHVMKPLRKTIAKHGCSFCLVHHHVKGGADRQGWRKGRGSSAMFDDADFWLRLEPVDGPGNEAKRDLHVDKNKYGLMNYSTPLTFNAAGAIFEQGA